MERVSGFADSPFVFNVFQAVWAALIPTLFALKFEPFPSLPWSPLSIAGLLILACASTLLAFLIQVRSQRVLPSSVVSMMFLLESPFAALFAFFLFHETMSPSMWLGAFCILTAAVGAVRAHRPRATASGPMQIPG